MRRFVFLFLVLLCLAPISVAQVLGGQNPEHSSGLAPAPKSYKVGDYYNENGKEGVVFEVDATGLHGKIIALDAAPKRMDWFEAKIYCRSLGDGWRLPTKEELLEIYEQQRLINGLREKAVIKDDWYWSSTESSDVCSAWYVCMYYGFAYGYGKILNLNVCAVSAF